MICDPAKHETRFSTPDGQRLLYANFGRAWRFIHHDPEAGQAVVGPIYKSKAELLADAHRFAAQFGFPA